MFAASCRWLGATFNVRVLLETILPSLRIYAPIKMGLVGLHRGYRNYKKLEKGKRKRSFLKGLC